MQLVPNTFVVNSAHLIQQTLSHAQEVWCKTEVFSNSIILTYLVAINNPQHGPRGSLVLDTDSIAN